ncbi:MAG: hypothetical protein IJJ23_09485 [Clostridia bacterium]|nr:hypothetical protein [Clostridia bacterium]
MRAPSPARAFFTAIRRGAPWDAAWFFAPMLRDRAAVWLTVPGASALLCREDTECLFSLPTAVNEAASGALVDAMLRAARDWGCERITGPVSPAAYDFCRGLRIEGFQTPFDHTRCPGLMEALGRRGFETGPVYDLFSLEWDEGVAQRQRRLADEVTRRFSLRSETFLGLGGDGAARAMAAISVHDGDMRLDARQARALFLSLGRALDRRLSQIVFRGEEPVACVLAVRKGRRLRVVTAQVVPSMRRMGVTAVLAAPFLDAMRPCGGLELGVISEDNLPSLACVRALGAVVTARYALLERSLKEFR